MSGTFGGFTLVAGCLVLAGVTAGCHRAPAMSADLIIRNARVFPADGSGTFAEALAVRGHQIVAVGKGAAIDTLQGDATRVIDAHGASVTPGFNDAHVHFLQGSLTLDEVNLLDAERLEQVQEAIRAFAAAHTDRQWVLGFGWLYGAFPGGLPTRQQLDELVPDRPAMMDCYDFHTRWVNSKALALAGITRTTPDPPNGQIVRDPRTGEPTGALKESAAQLMDKVLPKPSREEKLAALRLGIAEARRLGVTSVQDADAGAEDLQLFETLRKSGELTLRVYAALGIHDSFTVADADRFDSLRRSYPATPELRLGAVKLFADGVIEAHTAYMLAPYANRATRGTPNYTASRLNQMVTLADQRGWQILIHAIGDAGIRMALDAYDSAAAANAVPSRGRRHRIEHIEAVSAEDIPRFGRMGVIASMQPMHASPNQNVLEVWSGNIGRERASRAWAWKSIKDAGGRLAFGTDWPVVGLDPRPGVHSALTRQTAAGLPAGGFVPAQRLPLATVIETYTAGSAYAEFEEAKKGTLSPGMLADIVIWDADIFALPVDKVKDAVVATTIFDGRVVYER
ncbi:MAG: amidohydrolase [Gemmatimonadota bacterium]